MLAKIEKDKKDIWYRERKNKQRDEHYWNDKNNKRSENSFERPKQNWPLNV